jgi:hypothetical protein
MNFKKFQRLLWLEVGTELTQLRLTEGLRLINRHRKSYKSYKFVFTRIFSCRGVILY